MPPELAHDEDYVSEEDSDFAPEDAPAEESSVSDDDEPAPGKRKRQGAQDGSPDEGNDAGFENSGDEAIIEKGKKRQRRSKKKGGDDGDDDGGEGGLIKTRRMRAAEKAERRADFATGPVTIDVDALWAQMTSEPVDREPQADAPAQPKDAAGPQPQPPPAPQPTAEDSDLIRIKRTYNFAGKVHTEEKLVARDSAEAKLYLAEAGAADATSTDTNANDPSSEPPKRLPRKAFRSAFEPLPADGSLPGGRSDLNLGMSVRLRARELAREGADAKKLNTVEKSRMDWAGYVDREGIKDELELAGKSKHSFAARQDFLARSEAVREEEARRVRVAGRV